MLCFSFTCLKSDELLKLLNNLKIFFAKQSYRYCKLLCHLFMKLWLNTIQYLFQAEFLQRGKIRHFSLLYLISGFRRIKPIPEHGASTKFYQRHLAPKVQNLSRIWLFVICNHFICHTYCCAFSFIRIANMLFKDLMPWPALSLVRSNVHGFTTRRTACI